jgi:hypothetical protein
MHPTVERLYLAARALEKLSIPAKVALALEESQQTLKHWEARGMSSRGVVKACKRFGISAVWLTTGQGEMQPKTGAMDHPASYQAFEDATLTREQLMTLETMPARFVFALEDDAMAPFGRAGTEVLFASDVPAKIGAGVLVKDKEGALFVRRKAQGASADHWLAVAPNSVYRSLDSLADGLRVLGVWRGVVNRGLEDA